ncbi:LysR family transcriptional regulator [Rhizobium sp. CAU 1783]
MNFNALDLNLIRVFDALMHERSVTRAGERIGLSQPAVSAALNRLRQIFNDALFVRQGNEMLPTPLASQMGERASAALAEIEDMIRGVRGLELATLERTFSLSGADFFSMLLMPPLSRAVRQEAPCVRMRLLDSARGDVGRLLAESTVDLALERPIDVPDYVSSTKLFHSPFVIVGAKDNPSLASVEPWHPMPIQVFSALPHVLRSIDGSMSGMIDEALAASGQRRNVVLALPHFQAVALAAAGGDMIAALPVQFALTVCDDLQLSLYLPPIPVPAGAVNLYWHARYDKDPAHKWLREVVTRISNDLGFANYAAHVPEHARELLG